MYYYLQIKYVLHYFTIFNSNIFNLYDTSNNILHNYTVYLSPIYCRNTYIESSTYLNKNKKEKFNLINSTFIQIQLQHECQ